MYRTARRDETRLEELYRDETHRIATAEFADVLARVIAWVEAT
ncbi:MAG TPA: hypothetical protein VGQ84_14465 [Gaiellaceae bacterium]|jgi:hypothetical protein|nr:hypothetical protein [Gaiellaceae bacterium]